MGNVTFSTKPFVVSRGREPEADIAGMFTVEINISNEVNGEPIPVWQRSFSFAATGMTAVERKAVEWGERFAEWNCVRSPVTVSLVMAW